MTTEKALREALKFYAACVGVEGEEAFLDDRGEKARAALSLPETAGGHNFPDSIYSPFNSCVFKSDCIQQAELLDALSLPETQGEPVAWVADAPDPAPESVDEPAAEASEQIIGSDGKAFPQTFDAQAWAKAFNETLTVLGHPKHDEGWLIGWFANAIMRGFDEAHWRAAPPSQPAQGWRLVPVEPTQAMMEAAAPFPEHLRAEHPNPDDPWHEGMFIATKCDQLAARTTYRAMLAAVPAAPTQAKPTNGEGA